MPKSIVDHLQATEQEENVQASQQAVKQHTDVADQLSLPKLLTENSKNESPIGLEQHTDRLDQEQPHSENQLQEAETNSFQLAEQETGSAGQQIFADSKVDPAQPLGDQQHIAQIVGQQEPTSAQDARKRGYQPSIPFNMLIPILQAHLDRDKDMQLQTVWAKLRRNDIHKDDFLRVIRNIVGDQMLKQAAHKVFAQMQAQAQRNNQANANQHPLLSQGSTTQQSSSSGSAQSHDQQVHMPTPSNPGQKSQVSSQPTPPNLGQKIQASSQPAPPNPGQKSQASSQAFATISDTRAQNNRHYFFAHNNPVPKPDAKGTHIIPNRPPSMRPAISLQMQTMNKQQQVAKAQQASQQIYGTTNPPAQSYPRPISDLTPLRSLSSESETRPSLHPHGMVSAKIGTAPTHLTMQHNAGGQQMQQNKDLSCNAGGQQMQQNKDLKTSAVNPSANTKQDSEPAGKARLVGTGSSSAKLHGKQASPNRSTPPVTRSKKSGAQKKPLETAGSTPPPSSKKQKTSGAFQLQEQSIDQLNDVTAVSGVNLREEEEQLLSTPKEESRVSIAARLIAQEEEENLFLQKGPLLKKLSGIILASNLKNISCDVERCLSMCVEERLRRFISTIIRFSKQRIDTEKTGHRLVITSDVGRHILQMNQKAKEEWDKKQAEETGKNKKQTEVDGSGEADLDKEKEESRPKNVKPNKEEDDKMRTTAANVAARQAVGGSDMLSKWQLMAEQARQKREGLDVGSASQRALVPRPSHMLGKGPMENQEASKRTHSAAFGTGGMNRQGRGPFAAPHSKGPQRTVSVKDVISALEREPQMTKSRLIYRLYERLHGDSNTD